MENNKILKEAIFALNNAEDADERGLVLRDFAVKLHQPEYEKLVSIALCD
ncbi:MULTISPECIES: hypothetical protein [unclassified Lactococcus]|nr:MULTISPECIES: hypothetical protein [unclassified Lactococcus]MQW23684.1 hypothetical protein [Lactococcus sp. dk101]